MAERQESMAEEITQEQFEETQREQGGVIPSRMALAKVYVETQDYIYKIYQDGDRYYVETGNPALQDGMVVAISSQHPDKTLYIADWIGKNVYLNLTTPYGCTIITKAVRGATFEGVTDLGEPFTVEVWD
jgi:hypothetical protein